MAEQQRTGWREGRREDKRRKQEKKAERTAAKFKEQGPAGERLSRGWRPTGGGSDR
jgi:hypothetical protein